MAQSSYGTTDIGRFDLTVDTDKGGITDWTWERVLLTEDICEFDSGVDDLADKIVFHKKSMAEGETLCEFNRVFEQKSRLYESDLGDLVADAFLDMYPVDLVIVQSGSIRRTEVGPKVTEKDLREMYPFNDQFVMVDMSGKELKDAFDYLFSLKPFLRLHLEH